MRGAIALLAGLALAAPATAAPPLVTDAAAYAWGLGDGRTASGPVVAHVDAAEPVCHP